MIDVSQVLLYMQLTSSNANDGRLFAHSRVERVLTAPDQTALPVDLAWSSLPLRDDVQSLLDQTVVPQSRPEVDVIQGARRVIMGLAHIPVNEDDDRELSEILDRRLATRSRTLI